MKDYRVTRRQTNNTIILGVDIFDHLGAKDAEYLIVEKLKKGNRKFIVIFVPDEENTEANILINYYKNKKQP